MSERGPGRLSPRQREILRLVAHGYTNKAIARGLGITECALHRQLALAYARLGVGGRAARTRAAIRLLDGEFPRWRAWVPGRRAVAEHETAA